MLGREPTVVPFSTEAMQSNLLRLQNEWETVQASHDRDAIYGYLAAVFELVMWWDQERKAVSRARRALHLRGYSSVREPEPFAALILCTADRDQVDDRTRSKWSRALRYAAEHKDADEPLRDFIIKPDYRQGVGSRGSTDISLSGMRPKSASRNAAISLAWRSRDSSRREEAQNSNRSQIISKYGANGLAQFRA
jgi:hypothetical protein